MSTSWMATLDEAVYYVCGSVFLLHSLAALVVVFVHGRCSVYAATFLVACAMWVDLTVLNLWFFLPTAVAEASRVRLPALDGDDGAWGVVSAVPAVVGAVVFSDAAWYAYLMLSGWFVGSMSLSNALAMWQREGCDALDEHAHASAAARWLVRAAYQAEEWVGIGDVGERSDLYAIPGEERAAGERASVLFALPRRLHRYYVFIVAQPIRLGGQGCECEGLEEGVARLGEKAAMGGEVC